MLYLRAPLGSEESNDVSTKWRFNLFERIDPPKIPPKLPPGFPEDLTEVGWQVDVALAYANETVESFSPDKKKNLCLTLLTTADFPGNPTCRVTSVKPLEPSTSPPAGNRRRMSQSAGIVANSTMNFETTNPVEVEQATDGIEELSTATFGDETKTIAVNEDIYDPEDPPPTPSPEPSPPPSPPVVPTVVQTPTPPPSDFYLDPNGVTVRCPNAANLATGVVNGITYTKRNIAQLQVRS